MTHPQPSFRRAVSVAVAAFCAAAGVSAVVPPPAAAAAGTSSTVRVAASDDSYVSSARPTYGFGGSDSVVAGAKGGDRMTGFVKFTVAALPAGSTVARAEVKLSRDTSTPLPSSVSVRKVGATSWTEAALTGRNAPSVGAEVATVKPAASAGSVSFDVTTVVAKAGTYTFGVTSSATNAIARFQSTEKGGNGPQLILTLKTPAPTRPVTTPGTNCTVDAKLVPSCNVL
ncbi:CBM96 family carbohydrate-binding protein, partial [Virgisporangium ochraceum]|uniref:CBM96 family carbohydrate-binding protein n=1 Tax=Virgisporangium ochraceum TaxID=65505 RepID=UPI0027DA6D66